MTPEFTSPDGSEFQAQTTENQDTNEVTAEVLDANETIKNALIQLQAEISSIPTNTPEEAALKAKIQSAILRTGNEVLDKIPSTAPESPYAEQFK